MTTRRRSWSKLFTIPIRPPSSLFPFGDELQMTNVTALLVIGGYLMRFFFLIQAGTKKMTGSNNAFFFFGGGGFLGCVAPVC